MKKILIIGFVWPEPDSSAAGSRMMQLIHIFKENNWDITFVSPALDSEFMTNLVTLGVTRKSITLNCESFDVFIKNLNPSIVLFDRFMIEEQFGWRVAEQCPNALRILDTEDLHCLRLARQKAIKENRKFANEDLLKEDVAKREIASVLRCDISLMVSEVEIELLQTVFKVDSSLLYYLPLLIDSIDKLKPQYVPDYYERKDFMFIGNFLHNPNWDAVQYLKEIIWPLIRKQIPESNLYIYGAYTSPKVHQLNNSKAGFYIMGRATEAKEVIKTAKVMLAPLRFGAGIKGKLLESMEYGTPNVTTTIGSESMDGNLAWSGFVADEPQDFANKAVKLYNDEIMWKEAQKNGFNIIENRYLKILYAADFINHIQLVQNNLGKYRLNNFFGAMLRHHTVTSTKYMSKWIEAKNK